MVSRSGNSTTFTKQKKTPSTLRRDQERMAMFLQRKKSRGNFTTSTPAPQTSSPHTLPTSSSQAVETSNGLDSVCRKTPSLVTTAVEQGEKCAKRGLTDEDWVRMDAIMDKHLGKSLDKKLGMAKLEARSLRNKPFVLQKTP